MSTMATELKATTMDQRMKALLDERDWSVQGTSIINPEIQRLFHQGTPAEELRRSITNDSRWALLNSRQKAFILAEVDLVGCPVRVGDTIEILTDRPQGAGFSRGDLTVVTGIERPYVSTRDGWVVNHPFYRLVTSLEFPEPTGEFSTVTDVNPESVENRAQGRINPFVRHSNETGDWGNCECRFVMGGVDEASRHFFGWGIGSQWARTPEGKRYIGEVVRWMRAMAVQKWIDQQPREATVVEPTHEPEPEPTPEPDLTPVEPTIGAMALRIDEMTTQVVQQSRDMDRLRAENRTLREWQTSAIEDAEKFCNTLSEIAERRELCSEFEESIDSANRVTSVLQFESTRTRSVEVQVSGTITRSFSISVTVERRSGDDDSDVEQRASEMVENDYSMQDLFRNYYSNDPEMEIDEVEIQ